MSSWMWIVLGAVTLGIIAYGTLRAGGLRGALAQARRTGDLTGVVLAVERVAEAERPTKWDAAINDLWQTYEREAAARLITEAAQRTNADIVHYWIAQVLQVEPEIAATVFTQEFLDAHFDPDAAARCGRCGSCGCG